MTTKYIITDIQYTLKDVKLGSLIPARDRPTQDTIGPLKPLVEDTDYTCRNQKNVVLDFGAEGKTSFEAGITKFFKLFGSSANSSSVKLDSKEARIHELTQPKIQFRTLVESAEGKKWLDAQREEGEKPHMVVGYKTYLDTGEKTKASHDSTAGAELNAPIGALAHDPGAALPGGSALDSKFKADRSSHDHANSSSELPGERIFAISLRKVMFRFFKSNAEGATLKNKNCWLISGFRGSDDDDAVEVDLDDSFGDDLEVVAVQESDSGRDEFVVAADESDED